MNIFVDTSILVPVLVAGHPHHVPSLAFFGQCSRERAFCAAHSLVETYSTLTRLPQPFRAKPERAMLLVDQALQRLTPVALTADEYARALREAVGARVSGGAVYDFMISRCAIKADAEVLYTWNLRHYEHFRDNVARRVRTPALVD